jgi:hypothetical protein
MSQTTMEFQYLMLNNIYRRAEEERKQPTPPDLSKFDDYFIKEAMKLWKMGKDDAILTFISNERCLSFVADNSYRLIARGTYEKCLLPAYIRTRTNHSHWYKRDLEIFFMRANKQKLLRAGDKLPDTNEFILYRGGFGHHLKGR